MPPKHCWNLSHHHLSFASIDGEDLSFSHSHRSHSELGRCIVHSDAARTSHTWPSHSTSNHCRMAGHTTCQRSKSNSLQFHKHHVALSYFCMVFSRNFAGFMKPIHSLDYFRQFQRTLPLVVRTPSAACRPWMSSGLVSIRTRITFSPSLHRRTASSAEKTTSATRPNSTSQIRITQGRCT